MKKISKEFIIDQYRSGIESYKDFTIEAGLWESEKYVFEKYIRKDSSVLDVGCGTGRTTFGLIRLGFDKVIGLDLTPEMIFEAQKLNATFNAEIDFRIGDAADLDFNDQEFDAVIFSFNGIMTIPNPVHRLSAFKEINRVLKDSGLFIFTTHDRNRDEEYFQFWEDERNLWAQGKQRSDLYEFGDIITDSKNESREIFIHIPDMNEVKNILQENNFELLETFYRSDKFDESAKVKMKSSECRFWIVKKILPLTLTEY